MNKYNYDLCTFIGRFQILTEAHAFVIKEALSNAENVLVLIGSSNQPRSHRNPFTFEERKKMIEDTFKNDRIIIRPLVDTRYNDTKWVENVQRAVAEVTSFIALNNPKTTKSPKPSVALIGHSKDASSYYLKLFPQWDSINVPNFMDLSATPMRMSYFSNIGHLWVTNADGHKQGDKPIEKLVPTPVKEFLQEFLKTPDYMYIREEYEFIQNYKKQWTMTVELPNGEIKTFPPYPINFMTVDAIVIQSGNILMVKRRERPGKGQWALPGGFVQPDETMLKAMLRELKEETKIKVPPSVLEGSIKHRRIFDDPDRSSRGRTITEAFLIVLKPDTNFPNITKPNADVEGADDAEKAAWIPLADLDPTKIFEDHYDIISCMTAFI
jgi:bifunctional NMN adenylyltransferase/nudix hydrolase